MKRVFCIAFVLIVASVCFGSVGGTAFAELPSPKAEILMEASTGQVLYSKNADSKLPQGSVTKEMSLLLWAEDIAGGRLSLEEKVKASAAASAAEGSVIWLETGEEMTAAELLEAVIISSANDACIALAEHTAGSEAAFVKRMNARAEELGMTSTRYANCTGYDAAGHYTSAKDTAILTAELMKHDVYRGWMLTWLDYLRGGGTQLVNTNRLIRTYNGMLGGKTGTTDNAGCCLAACAERGDMRLVAVALGCADTEERFDSVETLLDYGFAGYEKFTPEEDLTRLSPVKVSHGIAPAVSPTIKYHGGECVIKKGHSADVLYEYTFVEQAEAPVKKGQFLGEYLVTLDGVEVYRSEIVAREDVPRMDFGRSLCFVLAEVFNFGGGK